MKFKMSEDENGLRVGVHGVISNDELDSIGFEDTPVAKDDEPVGVIRDTEVCEDGRFYATIKLTDLDE